MPIRGPDCLPFDTLRPGIGLALLRSRHGAVPPQARPGGPRRLRVRQKRPLERIPTESVRGLADKSSLAEKHIRPGSPSPAAPSRRRDPSSPPLQSPKQARENPHRQKEPRATRHPAQPTRPASPSRGRITGSRGRAGIRPCRWQPTSSFAAFGCTCCPRAYTASAIMDCSPTAIAPNIARARELLGVPSCSPTQRSERNNNSRPHWTAEHPRATRGAARPLWVSRAKFPFRGSQ